jgi:ABC-2 type transport system permease protein
MRRSLGLVAAIFVVSLKREIAFRQNLAVSFLQAGLVTATSFTTISIVFSRTDLVAGWTQEEMLAVLGFYLVIDGILATFVEPNLLWFSGFVRDGKLDDLLLKPVPALLLVTLGSHSPLGLAQVVLGGMVIWIGVAGMATGASLVLALGMLGVGIVLAWAYRTAIALLALWFPSLTLDVLFSSIWQFGRFPVAIFEQPFRLVFTWVIPLGLISTLPAVALMRGPGAGQLVGATLFGVGASVGIGMMWRLGMRRYTGATS